MLSFKVILVLAALALVVWYVLGVKGRSSSRPLPPGPPRLPIIGNLHQAPKLWPWRTYREWSKQYGPIFSLKYGGDTIIMLSNHTTARDLLVSS